MSEVVRAFPALAPTPQHAASRPSGSLRSLYPPRVWGVVLGGVGQLAGTVIAAAGLGIVNKLLEPTAGAVLAKIVVLGFIILFIQRRPQGLFALRGRAADE